MAKPRDAREYVRLSVTLPSHPKLARIDDPRAGWLYTVGLCHAGEHLTDGLLTPGVVQRIAGVPARWSKALLTEGLWHAPGHDCPTCPQPPAGQVIVHDYLQHQRSRAEAEELRTKRSEAGARGNAKRWDKDREPIASAIANGSQVRSQTDRKTIAEVEEEEEKSKTSPGGDVTSALALRPGEDRPDVQRICDHLADRIAANGTPRPKIGKRWLDAGRLLIDRDHRTEEQIHAAINWCQDHEFWRANILSMAKLRDQYDQLRLQASRSTAPAQNGRLSPGDRALSLATNYPSEAS